MAQITIQKPELLHIREGQQMWYGADQQWYPARWQRQAGCGPTACSHLMWYLSQTRRRECESLCRYNGSERPGFVRLMQDIWRYVTPGLRGVNSARILVNGALTYGIHRGVALREEVLHIPETASDRPTREEMARFLQRAMERDLPVAFLNLSNGALKNLDNWHWVTLVGFDPAEHTAWMFDQGKSDIIDVGLWLESTKFGGAFVILYPQE